MTEPVGEPFSPPEPTSAGLPAGLPPEALPPRDQLDPDQRVAFGRFVKTELYDIFGEHDLESLTDQEKAWVYPSHLGPMLFTAPAEVELQIQGLSLNPLEFQILARWPRALARHAVAKTLGVNELDAERLAASRRSIEHTFETKREAMTDHVDKMAAHRADINRLQRRVRTPGYAHETAQYMKQLIASSWQEFQDILDVLHVQRGWEDETRQRVDSAMVSYLTQGAQNTRIGHWKEMLGLADAYLGARTALFRNRIKQVSRS